MYFNDHLITKLFKEKLLEFLYSLNNYYRFEIKSPRIK
jgi:hypothetical protein